MTREELVAWALRRGLAVMTTAEFEDLCAAAAAGIAAGTDLDRELLALLGRQV